MPRSSDAFVHLRRLFAAWTAVVIGFLYLPIILLVVFSLNRSRLNIVWQGFTLDWYRQLLQNRPLIEALQNSLSIAAVVTVLSVLLGTAAAWVLYRYRFGSFNGVVDGLLAIPIVMPDVIMGVSLLIGFSIVCSWVDARLVAAGSTARLGLGFCTVILSHVTFCFPFVAVVVRARLAGLDPSLEEAAMDLGASPGIAFRRVVLPYLFPSIIAGGLMAFTLSLDELIITFFTTGPNSVTLPIRIFGMAKVGLNPMLNAISTLLIITTALLISVAETLRHSQETA